MYGVESLREIIKNTLHFTSTPNMLYKRTKMTSGIRDTLVDPKKEYETFTEINITNRFYGSEWMQVYSKYCADYRKNRKNEKKQKAAEERLKLLRLLIDDQTSMVFFNDSRRFSYEIPDDKELIILNRTYMASSAKPYLLKHSSAINKLNSGEVRTTTKDMLEYATNLLNDANNNNSNEERVMLVIPRSNYITSAFPYTKEAELKNCSNLRQRLTDVDGSKIYIVDTTIVENVVVIRRGISNAFTFCRPRKIDVVITVPVYAAADDKLTVNKFNNRDILEDIFKNVNTNHLILQPFPCAMPWDVKFIGDVVKYHVDLIKIYKERFKSITVCFDENRYARDLDMDTLNTSHQRIFWKALQLENVLYSDHP